MNEERVINGRKPDGDHTAKNEWTAPKLTELDVERTAGGYDPWIIETSIFSS